MTISAIMYAMNGQTKFLSQVKVNILRNEKKIEIGRFRNLAKVDMYWKKELDG